MSIRPSNDTIKLLDVSIIHRTDFAQNCSYLWPKENYLLENITRFKYGKHPQLVIMHENNHWTTMVLVPERLRTTVIDSWSDEKRSIYNIVYKLFVTQPFPKSEILKQIYSDIQDVRLLKNNKKLLHYAQLGLYSNILEIKECTPEFITYLFTKKNIPLSKKILTQEHLKNSINLPSTTNLIDLTPLNTSNKGIHILTQNETLINDLHLQKEYHKQQEKLNDWNDETCNFINDEELGVLAGEIFSEFFPPPQDTSNYTHNQLPAEQSLPLSKAHIDKNHQDNEIPNDNKFSELINFNNDNIDNNTRSPLHSPNTKASEKDDSYYENEAPSLDESFEFIHFSSDDHSEENEVPDKKPHMKQKENTSYSETPQLELKCRWKSCHQSKKTSKSFESTEQLHKHFIEEHFKKDKNGQHNCNWITCDYQTNRFDSLKIHVLTHTRYAPFLCPHSPCTFASGMGAGLISHLLSHKVEKIEAQKVVNDMRKTLPKWFSSKGVDPEAERENQFSCKCKNCNKFYDNAELLHKHCIIKHLHRENDNLYYCSWLDCTYKTSHVAEFKTHVHIHTMYKPFTCSNTTCNYKSGRGSALLKHFRGSKHGYSDNKAKRLLRELKKTFPKWYVERKKRLEK